MGKHTEALQVDFDSEQISFREIVNLFWSSHNPIGMTRGSQYKSAIWFGDPQQHAVIQETIEPLVARFQRDLTTEVLPLKTFYLAEDYHQKYVLQRYAGLMKSFTLIYPRFRDFIDSTSAARLNGFASGYGTVELFEAEKKSYGHDSKLVERIFRR